MGTDKHRSELPSRRLPRLHLCSSVFICGFLLLLFSAGLFASEPRIRIQVEGADAFITVVSDVPWVLYQSGDLKHWWEIYRGQPATPGAVQMFTGVDKGWVRVAQKSFYKVVKAGGKGTQHEQ